MIAGFAETCDGAAADTRVSSFYESFIIDTILSPPGLFFDGFESGDTSAWALVTR